MVHSAETGPINFGVIPQTESLWNPQNWKISCAIQSELLSLSLVEGSDESFQYIKKNLRVDVDTGDVISHIPNSSAVVKLSFGCFFNVFHWQCQIPHLVSLKRRALDSAPLPQSFSDQLPKPHPLAVLIAVIGMFVVLVVLVAFCCWTLLLCCGCVCFMGMFAQPKGR